LHAGVSDTAVLRDFGIPDGCLEAGHEGSVVASLKRRREERREWGASRSTSHVLRRRADGSGPGQTTADSGPSGTRNRGSTLVEPKVRIELTAYALPRRSLAS
jgi:hypothetical protein